MSSDTQTASRPATCCIGRNVVDKMKRLLLFLLRSSHVATVQGFCSKGLCVSFCFFCQTITAHGLRILSNANEIPLESKSVALSAPSVLSRPEQRRREFTRCHHWFLLSLALRSLQAIAWIRSVDWIESLSENGQAFFGTFIFART